MGLFFIFTGALTIIHRLLSAGYTRRWQTQAFIVTFSITITLEFYRHRFISGLPGVDYLALILALATGIYVITLYRYDLFGYRPVAKTDIIDTINDPAIVINPDKKLVGYNQAAFELVLEAEDESDITLGTDAHQLLPTEILNTDPVINLDSGTEEICLSSNGTDQYYDMNVVNLESSGDKGGIAIVLRDITELRERTQKLQRQTEQLNQFASIVSHDLRNPLQVASAYTGQLDERIDDDELHEVKTALDRMDNIIDDSLTLAREGRAIENRTYEPLTQIAHQAWDVSQTREASLVVTLPKDIHIRTDKARLKSLFENLYRNAVDHGPDNVTITVGLIDETPPHTGFYVADTGPGIPEDKREKVFKQGYTTANEGTGFGLAIVKSIANAHGWTVSVTESESGGARFEFTDVTLRSTTD